MYPVHGLICNATTFPLKCKYCSSGIFFFQCDHGSRVLFDSLGPPWPTHHCVNTGTRSTPRPSSSDLFRALQGVTFSSEGPNAGLLPGLRRVIGEISAGIARRANETESIIRETVRMEPYGAKRERICGVVSHIDTVSISDRFGIEPDSVVASEISRLLGGLQVTQLTILVDEYLTDSDAVDMMSYTVWRPVGRQQADIEAGDIVAATIRPRELIGIGVRWVAASMEHQ